MTKPIQERHTEISEEDYEKYGQEYLYQDEKELFEKTVSALSQVQSIRKNSLRNTAAEYDWKIMASKYDSTFTSYMNKPIE